VRMRKIVLVLLLVFAACAAPNPIAGLPENQVLLRSDGTELTVREQWNHLKALIEDQGYTAICTALMIQPVEPKGEQTQEDVEALHTLHKEACEQHAKRQGDQ
ncbi:MAG: hypothetical protein ACRD1R_09695, partial [Acidobacteriota bacterium]